MKKEAVFDAKKRDSIETKPFRRLKAKGQNEIIIKNFNKKHNYVRGL